MKNKSDVSCFIGIVCFLISSCSSGESKVTTRQATPSQSITHTVANGKLLFEQKCAGCHGSDGTAGIANAANLQTSKLDSISIIRIITDGKNAMPAFRDQPGSGEVEQIANYVKTLRK